MHVLFLGYLYNPLYNINKFTPLGDMMSNYTTQMIATLDDRSPITRAVADDLAAEFGLPVRSVISKAVLLGLYQKPSNRTGSARISKADMVKSIDKALQGESLDGLEGASMRSLSALLMSIQ